VKKTCLASAVASVFLATLVAGVVNAVQLEDLVLYLPFDEGEGNKVADLSSFKNDGIVQGCKWVEGVKDSALEFDGISYVEIPDNKSLDITDAITVIGWVKLTGAGGESPVVTKGPWGDQPYELTNHIGQKKAMFMAGQQICWSDSLIEFGTWYNLAGTFDGKAIRVYINGGIAGELQWGGPIPVNDLPLRIGMRVSPQEAYALIGTVDEVAIYNRALSETEIQKVVKQGINLAVKTTSSKLTTTWGYMRAINRTG